MKKRLLLALRILFAAAGLIYILFFCIDWKNQVDVKPAPPGTPPTVLANGDVITHLTTLRVVSGEMNPANQTADLTVLDPAKGGTVVIPAADLNNADRFLLRPSIVTTIGHADYRLLLIGLVLVGLIYPVQTYRWYILLRCRGIEVTYAKAFKLTMIGCFFNYCMPGSTGGDVIKAYYAAARGNRRADSIMSVLFDRITGLLGLVALGAIASLFMLHVPLTRNIAIFLWGGSAIGCLCAIAYFSRRLRRRLGIDWVLARLPGSGFIKHVDEAAMAYANHKGPVTIAILISIPVHLALTGATVLSGFAVGMQAPVGLLMTVVPIIFLSGTFPITPQGAGVWEALGKAMLFKPPLVTMNQIVAMLVLVRLYQLVYSSLGSLYLLRGDVHLHPEVEKPKDDV